jgi:LuxR family maltose regulon positive regulatory protein
MRAHLLQTLIRLGETGLVEAALAGLDAQQQEHGAMRITVAALRLAQDDPQAATIALAPVLDGSAPVTNLGWLIQAFLLEAMAHEALGDPAAAGRALERALDIAEPDGVLFAFLLHPAPALLERHARDRTAHAALISQILQWGSGGPAGLGGAGGRSQGGSGGMCPPEPGVPRGVAPRRLAEPLTQSQIRLLRYLPTNLSVPEIAAEVSLSVNTVRTHVRHLYEKLGAHGRTEAVQHARAVGLLAPSPRRP